MADLGEYDPDAKPVSFDPIPVGQYTVHIVESDVKACSGNGSRLGVVLEVLDGQHKGRKIFDGMLLKHDSAKAQAIGQGQLAALCLAAGVRNPKTSEELHNIPMQVKVKVRPAGEGKDGNFYEAKNEIAAYLPAGMTAAPVNQPPAADPAASAVPAKSAAQPAKAPWKR